MSFACMLTRRKALVLVAGFTRQLLFSQQADVTFTADVNVVNVLVSAWDGHGRILRSLTQNDFLIEEDGRPQAVRYFASQSDLPLTLGLIIDTSGSQFPILRSERSASMVACDFFVVFTARFRILYVLVIMEVGRRQILHHNVTAHPSAEWTLQQFREALTEEHSYRFLIYDRDSIFSKDLDKAVAAMGVGILKTPVRAPKANAVCERLVGTIRRECLDFLIPLGERHLKLMLTHWAAHYNHARVHSSLGPGVPDPIRPSPPMSGHRHRLAAGHILRSKAVLSGLHHEYWLEKIAA